MIEECEQLVQTNLRIDFVNVDAHINQYIHEQDFINGILTLFIPHTTAGIMINENADPDARRVTKKSWIAWSFWQNNYAHEGNSANM